MQVKRIENNLISYRANVPKTIAPHYKTTKSNTVAILGSSRTANSILKYMQMCSDSVKNIILNGKNIVTGCGTTGIMGSAYYAASEISKKNQDNKPIQNLAIITDKLWGNEDLENCILVASAKNEAERTEMFSEVADTMVIFAGSVTTLQETTTLITKNYYGKVEDRKKIILVGKDFFKGLIEQYDKLYETGLIKCKPKELFTVVDSEDELRQIL